jgi:alpha-galactosidase
LPPNQLDIVKEGIRVYKSIRNDIKTGLPFWPIGIPNFEDPWFVFGLQCNYCAYLAVWRIDGTPMINFLLPDKMKDYNSIELLYPHFSDDMAKFNPNGSLSITMKKEKTARLFKLTRM